jgi:hypothetical protein
MTNNSIRRRLHTLHAFNMNYEKSTPWCQVSLLKGSVANLRRCASSSAAALEQLIATGGVVQFDSKQRMLQRRSMTPRMLLKSIFQ